MVTNTVTCGYQTGNLTLEVDWSKLCGTFYVNMETVRLQATNYAKCYDSLLRAYQERGD